MNVKTLEDLFSQARVQIYRQAYPKNPSSLYEQNIMLSSSLYPVLCVLEVALRNSIDRACTKHFADNNWLVNQKAGFMSDPKLTYTNKQGVTITNDFLKKNMEEAEQRLSRRRSGAISHDGLIAELSFGFWTELFQPTHYALLSGAPIHAFSRLPRTIKRKHLFNILGQIRRFRNRIYHNEPICFGGGICDLEVAWETRKTALEVTSWISNDLTKWLVHFEDSPFEFSLTDRYLKRGKRKFHGIKRLTMKLKHLLHSALR